MNLAYARWIETEFEKAPLEIIDGDRGKNYPKQSDFSNSGYCLFLNTGNVTSSGFNFSECNFISRERDAALRKGRLQKGDVLLTTRGTVGNTAWVDDTIPYSVMRINSGMVIIRPNTEKLLPEFLYFFLRSPKFGEQVNSLTSGTAQPQLPIRDLKGIKIPLPPLEEQRRIAAILDKADDVRRKRKQAIALTEELLRSAFLEMFGDPVTNPKGWEVRKLSDLIVGKPNNGVFRKNDEYSGNIPVVWVKELFSGHIIDCTNSRTLDPTDKEIKNFGLKKGDILFCRSSLKLEGIGYNNVFDGDDYSALFECHTIRVSPDQCRVNSIFLNYLLRQPGPRKHLITRANTVTMSTIGQDEVMQILVPLPPKPIQDNFEKLLRYVMSVQQKLMINDEQNLFNSLLQKAFRGEL
ncbi:restriction endonuclease subunit S [Anabaena sp. CA = ATCC 33047]|uniref:restriction endonuclease subunit S n=1 Tax=Anabaena sp. (strain CA / ATCC 33047) TaxID=52271 RepID=UPI00082E44E2|nr:restriction endonuclease subunit S [Anabaena sp. CA = ATCC 33047]